MISLWLPVDPVAVAFSIAILILIGIYLGGIAEYHRQTKDRYFSTVLAIVTLFVPVLLLGYVWIRP